MAERLYIIDGHAQIYRAYYAPFRDLSSPTGEPTRATHVFCQMLLNLIRDRRPDYLVMVLDADESKLFRRQLYADYKAHREPPPEDLPPQEQRIVSILEAAGVPMLQVEGYEADDIIATLVRRLAGAELELFLVSRDKDLEQLLGENVVMYDPMKDEIITHERLLETKGWRPEQAIEAQILMGDDVDNVPGVRLVGAVKAAKLLQKYGSAQAVVEHADELTPKLRENVLAFAPQLELTRRLVTLRDDVPIDFDLDQARRERFDWAAARPIFEELGFRQLLERMPARSDEGEAAGRASRPPARHGRDARATPGRNAEEVGSAVRTRPRDVGSAVRTEQSRLEGGDYQLVNTLETLDALIPDLKHQSAFALDTETTSVNAIDAELVGLSFAWEVGRGYYIPVRYCLGDVLPIELVRERLAPILADPKTLKVGQNLKYDLTVLQLAEMPVAGPLFDTMIAAFVLDPTRGSYKLDKLVGDLLGHRMIPITDLIGKGRSQLSMDQVDLERVTEYAAEDADYTWRLKELFAPQLEGSDRQALFDDIEMPLVSVLTEMGISGISLDVDFLRKMGGELAARVAAITEEVHRLAGTQFNLDSPKQLGAVLFDKLGFRVVKKTKTTRSTDAETLEVLGRETGHPIFALLLEYREIQKLRGTYVDALPNDRSRRSGRIHTSYHQTGTVTGRLSSSEPNLQNIPIRTEAGRRIRRAFVPRSPDELLIVADYSQIELRVLAHLSEDQALIQAFAADQDIHAFVAAQVHGVALGEVTKEMRSRAKGVNFGIIYGQSAFGLAQATGMSRGEAQAFIDDYFRRYPRIRAFIERCIADAKRDGFVRTILGRRRPIENIASRNANARAQAQRFAVNTVIQGSAADLIKIAMIRLHERINREQLPLRMLLQVHDELVCEAPRDAAPALASVVADVMNAAMTLRVPLKVDIACGENWLEAK